MGPSIMGPCSLMTPCPLVGDTPHGKTTAMATMGATAGPGSIIMGAAPTAQLRPLSFATTGDASQRRASFGAQTTTLVHGSGPVLVGTSPMTSACALDSNTIGNASQPDRIGSPATSPTAMRPLLVGTCPITNRCNSSQTSTAA